MKRRVVARVLAFAGLLGLVACGGEGDAVPPTKILCVWDSVDFKQLNAFGAPHDTTPVLSELARESSTCCTVGVSSSTSTSASFATLLTDPEIRTALSSGITGPPQHGLFSIRELGHERIDPATLTIAESHVEAGWRTLASVSLPQFESAGLARGFETWCAPEVSSDRRGRSAAEVVEAIFPAFAQAVEAQEPVLLVLHFGDLRGSQWTKGGGHDAWLEERLAPWRGKGGPVDEAYEAFEREPEETSLLNQLKKRLLRRRDDERREALLESIYGARLGELDRAFDRIVQELKRAGRYAEAEVLVCGGPSCVPGEADELTDPGPRSCAPWILRGNAWQFLGAWGPCRHLSDSVEFPTTLPDYVAGAVDGAEATIVEGRTGALRVIDSAGAMSRRLDYAQRIVVRNADPEAAALSVTAASPDAELGVEGPEGVSRTSSASPRSFELKGGGEARIASGLRGADVRLVLSREDLTEDDLVLAGRPFVETDVPLLRARSAPPWPRASDGPPPPEPIVDLPEPIVDLQPTRGRRVKLTAPGPGDVRLLVEMFPADDGLLEALKETGATVRPHAFRAGAVWVDGVAPFDVELPPRRPSARLALAAWLDGQRVPAGEIRYEMRQFGAPGELELLLCAGVWIDPELRESNESSSTKKVVVQLQDPVPPPTDYRLPTPEERAFLHQLGDDE